MAKQKKKRQQSNRYSLLECTIRPVTKSDRWCKQKMPKGQIPTGDAPWGYVITIPYCPNQNTFLDDIEGYIVRTKKHCGNLLLQVIKKEGAPDYGIKSDARIEPNASRKNKKKRYRVLSIKNLNKLEGNWGKKVF